VLHRLNEVTMNAKLLRVLVPAFLAAGAVRAVGFEGVSDANPKVIGQSAPNVLTPELGEIAVAQGAHRLENPASIPLPSGATALVTHYGYNGDGPFVPLPGDVQTPTHDVEASKTEPDKNTYLVLRGQRGADEGHDYGTHFLYQGHETGKIGYLTRINLDADEAHRVTLMAATDVRGAPLPTFDGATWDPFARHLLLTAEAGSAGGVWQATVDFPSQVEDISGAMGRGGYEGVQADEDGNVWIVEDVGGPKGAINTFARQPNSFVYRFLPARPDDLTRGKLQALQVISLRTGQPIVFHSGQADADILSDDIRDLHTYGKAFPTRWITLHDTATDGAVPFDANALAKARGATPFKRPENGQFRPGTGFREFYFGATGDTDSRSQAGSEFGGFGAIFKLTQRSPSAREGRLTIFYRCDAYHSGFDNVAFWDRDHIVFVEDAGDTLHAQRNALDSAYLFDVRADYSDPAHQPVRILAQGRDASATIDSAYSTAGNGFQNEGDNEITGIHVSNGDPSPAGLLGASLPRPFRAGWRAFYTQQHGDNVTYEIVPAGDSHDGD
jgi:hypothetical protein